jgi:hypothetical protein
MKTKWSVWLDEEDGDTWTVEASYPAQAAEIFLQCHG